MKGAEFVHISSNNLGGEVSNTDDTVIILVSNSSTLLSNDILSNAYSCNKCLESLCIIDFGK